MFNMNYSVFRSTRPPILSGMEKDLICLIGAVVCLHVAPPVQLFSDSDSGWPRNALWYH